MKHQDQSHKVIGVIPARYGSTRFPGKVLAKIFGKSMIQWVYERAVQSKKIEELIIATDSEAVQSTVSEFGGKAVLTSREHDSGTDRVAEAVENIDAQIVVNIQGDEPMISPRAIDEVVMPFFQDESVQMTTLCRALYSIEEMLNPNTARVVFDQNRDALYFSRAAIPYHRDGEQTILQENVFQHIGVYAYQKSFLQKLSHLPQTPLEKIEKLEQLRVLEYGYKIRVVETTYRPICVDVPSDIEKVEKLINQYNQKEKIYD